MAHACRPRDSPGPASFGAYAEAMRAADLQVTDGEIVWRWDGRLLDRPRWPSSLGDRAGHRRPLDLHYVKYIYSEGGSRYAWRGEARRGARPGARARHPD